MKQEELATAIDRTVESISNLERGKSLPSFETLAKIAQTLDVPVRDFFDDAQTHEDPVRSAIWSEIQTLSSDLPDYDLLVVRDFLKSLQNRKKAAGGE